MSHKLKKKISIVFVSKCSKLTVLFRQIIMKPDRPGDPCQ